MLWSLRAESVERQLSTPLVGSYATSHSRALSLMHAVDRIIRPAFAEVLDAMDRLVVLSLAAKAPRIS